MPPGLSHSGSQPSFRTKDDPVAKEWMRNNVTAALNSTQSDDLAQVLPLGPERVSIVLYVAVVVMVVVALFVVPIHTPAPCRAPRPLQVCHHAASIQCAESPAPTLRH